MVRYFMKKSGVMSPISGESTCLHNYHIKTILLWACEQRSFEWWSRNSLICICRKLLHTLSKLVTIGMCTHYFIAECNLLDHLVSSSQTASMHNFASCLTTYTDERLTRWFVDNYVFVCAQSTSTDSIVRLLDEPGNAENLQRAMDEIIEWQTLASQVTLANDAKREMKHLRMYMPYMQGGHKLASLLAKFDGGILEHYVLCLLFRYVASALTDSQPMSPHSESFLCDCLYTAVMYSETRRPFVVKDTRPLSFVAAAKSLAVSDAPRRGDKLRLTRDAIKVELEKVYMHRVARTRSSGASAQCDSMYCLANVYLAVLYYKTADYRKAIDHCHIVTDVGRWCQHNHLKPHADMRPFRYRQRATS